MDPVTYPTKLCPLRPYGPTFLGETSTQRNKSHSPQPPIRKRLYSEDINSILMDVEINGKKSSKSKQISPVVVETFPERNEEQNVFSDEIINSDCKLGFFPEQEMEEIPIFEQNLLPLREESQFEERMDLISEEMTKEDKPKHHFTDIFDSGRKEILGKRAFMDMESKREKIRSKDRGKKKNLKLEENTTYLFNSKEVTKKRKKEIFGTPKQMEKKIVKRESKVFTERRGSQVQG
jgi:hypothetical protein